MAPRFYGVLGPGAMDPRHQNSIPYSTIICLCILPLLQVYLHDQVTFRVVNSTEGQYLHTSKLIYHDVGITLYGEW